MKTKTLIVEDEIHSQELIKSIIEEYCPELSVIGVVDSVGGAIEAINKYNPEVLFLDVQLKNENSFEIFNTIDHTAHKIIFTTAYRKFAFDAFKVRAVDYILKPYSPSSIVNAVQRVIKSISIMDPEVQMVPANEAKRIVIPTNNGSKLIAVSSITRIEAFGAYCKIYLTDNQVNIVSKNLKETFGLLEKANFVRVHMSHVINLDFMDQYIFDGEGGYAEMKDKARIPIARRRKTDFLAGVKLFQGQ